MFLGEAQTGQIAEDALAQITLGEFGNAPLAWVLDPIDGTSNYAHGIPIARGLAGFGLLR